MPFQPGQSGNPAGRPLGARNKTTVLMETLVERDGEALIHPFVEQAKRGNTRALAQLTGMILPKRKGAPIELDLPPLEQASDAPAAIAAVISAVCRGELTPEEGIMLTRMVEAFLRTKLNAEKLVRKLERLAEVAAAKVRETAQAPISRESEAASPTPATVPANAPAPTGEQSAHARAIRTLVEGLDAESLQRLREEAMNSTSALAQSAMEQVPIVSPLLNPLDSPPDREDLRAAA